MGKPLTVAKRPCGTCPYRTDVPSGVWAANEYDKLPEYDGPMHTQPPARFDCHQRDGHLCAGWLACHGAENLLSLRVSAVVHQRPVTAEVANYKTDVPVFASGQEACDHGKRDIDAPGRAALKKIEGLQKVIGKK